MSERHMYEVTEITADVKNCEVGSILVDKNHSSQDEPYRTWEFASTVTGEPRGYIVAKHLGTYEKMAPKLSECKEES